MVVGTLKKGLKGALPLIIIYFLVASALNFLITTNSQSDNYESVFYTLLLSNVSSTLAVSLVNLSSLAVGAVLISILAIREEMVEKTNYIPGFLYLLFGSIELGSALIHPSLIANVFILLALIYLIETYREDNVLPMIFKAAFFISLATFFYINYAFYAFLLIICLLVLRPFNWREWTIGFMGLSTPLLIYSSVGYLANYNFHDYLNNLGSLLTNFRKPVISEFFYPLFIVLIILLLLTASKHATRGLGSRIKTQKNLGLMYWLMLLSVINFFAKDNSYYFPLIASIIPISILLSDYFYNIKQLKVANTLFFLLIASSFLLLLMKMNLL